MPLTDEEALGLKLNQQVAMGKRIFTVARYENISGFKEPVLIDEKGERISSVLFVAHILNYYTPPLPKIEAEVSTEAVAEEPKEKIDEKPQPSTPDEAEDDFKLV